MKIQQEHIVGYKQNKIKNKIKNLKIKIKKYIKIKLNKNNIK